MRFKVTLVPLLLLLLATSAWAQEEADAAPPADPAGPLAPVPVEPVQEPDAARPPPVDAALPLDAASPVDAALPVDAAPAPDAALPPPREVPALEPEPAFEAPALPAPILPTVPEAPAPKLELVVVGPSEEVFTLFGHIGVLVRKSADEPLEAGVLYNFGVTDFDRPNYITDFLSGRVRFYGKTKPYGQALERWKKADRTVERYPLNLPELAARRMTAQMANDVLPDRREYVYDTFRENCATRIRDYLDRYTGGALFEAFGERKSDRTYHDDVRVAFARRPLLLLLTELIPGVEMDRARTRWALAYRPQALAEALADVKIRFPEGVAPLLGPKVVDYERHGPAVLTGSPNRGQIFLLLEALILIGLAIAIPRLSRRGRGIGLVLASGGATLFGLLLVVVTLSTGWPDMRRSFLVLGFTPLDVLLVVEGIYLILRREVSRLAKPYLIARLTIAGALLLASPFSEVLRAPYPPKVLALAYLFFCWRSLCAANDD